MEDLNSRSRELLRDMEHQMEKMRSLRPLCHSEASAEMPVALVDGVCHQPVDPMHFQQNVWTDTPWPGVKCLGLSLSPKEVVILCDVLRPIRMDKQEHGPWCEKLLMLEGVLYEHSTAEQFEPGKGVYLQPAGEVHEPEFKTPSRCVITWTRN